MRDFDKNSSRSLIYGRNGVFLGSLERSYGDLRVGKKIPFEQILNPYVNRTRQNRLKIQKLGNFDPKSWVLGFFFPILDPPKTFFLLIFWKLLVFQAIWFKHFEFWTKTEDLIVILIKLSIFHDFLWIGEAVSGGPFRGNGGGGGGKNVFFSFFMIF